MITYHVLTAMRGVKRLTALVDEQDFVDAGRDVEFWLPSGVALCRDHGTITIDGPAADEVPGWIVG